MTASEKTEVRVRYAPSPTGHWHLGGARTTLFNWLFARKHGGKFILRIEDTDKERSAKKYEIEIVESLKWLGLDWDEGPDWNLVNHAWQPASRGDFGPYRQSERTTTYAAHLEKLLGEKRAYYCYCTKEELEAQRESMEAQGLPPKYSGHCRALAQPPEGKTPTVVRFATPEVEVEFRDLVRGTVKFDAGLFGDFVIAKDISSPLYNFAVAVDDEEMQITHVIRGEDLLSSTPRQILLQRALGFREPIYAHLPLILSPDRGKLSKRYAETSLFVYREAGYLPEAIVNFLALLGWHPKDDREIFSAKELVEAFDLKRVQKAGAVFNQEKLDWLNAQHLRRLDAEEIADRLKPFLRERGIDAEPAFLKKVIEAERERMKTLADLLSLGSFFFKLPDYPVTLLAWKNEPAGRVKTVLEKARGILEAAPEKDFTREKLMSALEETNKEHGRGEVLWPLRAALSGQAASPDPLLIAEILGKEETLRRVAVAIGKLGLAI